MMALSPKAQACGIVVDVLGRPVRGLRKSLKLGFRRVRWALVTDVLDPRKGSVITLPRPGSDQLFFVYTGRAQRLGLDPRAFFMRTRLFERNVALLRDEHGAFYQRGVSSSLDSFEALLGWHHEYRASLPHVRRVFCLGTSMGAYAAILFGYLLKAEQVWALGTPATRLDDAQGIPANRADLAALLARPNGVTTFHVHYSEGCARDVEAIQRISGCQGVRLHPHPGEFHAVVRTMLDRGALETLLPDPM
jgi:hypothetical protein